MSVGLRDTSAAHLNGNLIAKLNGQRKYLSTIYPNFKQLLLIRFEAILVLDGELFAVNTEEKTFGLRADAGETIHGAFPDAITAEHAASVPHRYKATIVKTSGVVKTKKDKPVTYSLQKLDPL